MKARLFITVLRLFSNDRKRETPQYFSFPISTGEDLAFSNLPTAVNLFIADSPSDTGKEPYNASPYYWCSPDIWMRINNDSIQQHENPIFETGHHYAYISVKVKNRGKGDGGGKWLHLYWAYSSTGISDRTWNGREYYMYNRLATGGYFPPQRTGSIASGDSKIFLFKWDISPSSTWIGLPKNKQHICFYAKILDTAAEYGFVPGNTFFTPKENNNEAQRSIAVIDDKCLPTYAEILVPNVYDHSHTYSLEFIPASPYSANFFANGYIEMSLPKNTEYDLVKSDDVQEIDTPTTSMPNRKRLSFRGRQTRLVGVNINPQEILQLGIKFNITNLNFLNTADTISFHLIQRDELNKITGAVTYIIPPISLSSSQISVSSENLSEGCVKLSAEMEDLQHVSWYDENDKNNSP